jgi:uncharacterized protein
MKLSRLILNLISLVLILFGLAGSFVQAQDYPQPVGYVNDFANLLSADARSRLETRLTTLEKDTSAEVTFVCVETIGNSTLEEYAAGLFQDWGIGKKGKDNGVLFLVSLAEGDVRIEVGYGLESIITDGRAGRILDNEVVSYFKQKDFDQGVEKGLIAIEGYIRDGTPPPVVEENPVQSALAHFNLPFPLLIGLGIITIYMLGFMARTKSIWLGGVWGFILGLILGFGFGSLVFLITLPLGLGLLGTGLDAILSSNYKGRQSGGMPTGWFSSGGGFKGPGGGFGGFGGFGGGGSGGGGASRHF